VFKRLRNNSDGIKKGGLNKKWKRQQNKKGHDPGI
jgi:hypothetical protein